MDFSEVNPHERGAHLDGLSFAQEHTRTLDAGPDGPDAQIGQPFYFTGGDFEGQWIRASLVEIQSAVAGRK